MQQFVCKLTIVTPGLSDSRINIFPAEHEEEKIWLSGVKGIERWEMIQRNMAAYAEKGTRIPKPVPYHNDPKNLMTVTLKEADVPLVRLDGWVLPPPPPEEKSPDFGNAPNSMLEVGKRISDLEKVVSSLAQAVSTSLQFREQPKPSKQRDDLAPAAVPSISQPFNPVACCGKTFESKKSFSAHKRWKHGGN